MAIKTMSASTGGSKFSEGWHELSVSKAEYGTYENGDKSKKYIDVWFQDMPENMNMRVYETFNKKDNTEFKIANLFKFANAGIVGVLNDPNGKHPLIQYDDEASGLVDKVVNVYFYKETKTGNGYTRVFDDIAPIPQEGEHLTFTSEEVAGIKKGVEERCKKVLSGNFGSAKTESSEASIPW
tara:strand:- start:73 stop:618 length:546 start_codon:yes stop_codon:yes gene_type:complete